VYKTLIIVNELLKEPLFISKTQHEPFYRESSDNNNMTFTGNTRNFIHNQMTRDNKIFEKEPNKTNGFIHIAEDYKVDQVKVQHTKNYSSFHTYGDEKKTLQIHVTRNPIDKKTTSDTDLRLFRIENSKNSVIKKDDLLNTSNHSVVEKKHGFDYKSKLEGVRTDIYNSWRKTQSPITESERK